jgi:hypothetical protein
MEGVKCGFDGGSIYYGIFKALNCLCVNKNASVRIITC